MIIETHYKGHQIVQQIIVNGEHYIITRNNNTNKYMLFTNGKKIAQSDNAKVLKAKNGLEDFA